MYYNSGQSHNTEETDSRLRSYEEEDSRSILEEIFFLSLGQRRVDYGREGKVLRMTCEQKKMLDHVWLMCL